MEVALKNKIPALQSTHQPGAFDEQTVLFKVDQLLADSRSLYKDTANHAETGWTCWGSTPPRIWKNWQQTQLLDIYLPWISFDKTVSMWDQSVAPVEISPLDKKYQAL